MGWITAVPNLFGARDQFKGRHVFPQTGVGAWFGGDSRALRYCAFISIVITSAPPQVIRHSIPEIGDPYITGSSDFSERGLYVPSSTIYNSQDMETTEMTVNR